jgi:hypothetical protein
MSLPPDHAALLRQQDFVVPAVEGLTPRERMLLVRYGRWLEGLSSGILKPLTPEQEHFVRVACGDDVPGTEFEHTWVKLSQTRSPGPAHGQQGAPFVGPLEVASQLERLAQARRSEAAVQAEYQKRHAAVMEQVRAELESLDAEFSSRLRAANEEVSRLEAEVRKIVLQHGESVKHGGIQAVYVRGRVSWDTRALNRYAETHSELQQFRKVGAPSVSIRYKAEPVGLGETSETVTGA